MQVSVRLFAGLRERAGAEVVELELPEGGRVADVLERLGGVARGLPVVMAVNQEYAAPDTALHPGDELALIPPVSGGAVAALHVRVTDQPLALDPLLTRVRDPRAGAVVSFLGVTREVSELQYEAYIEMAEKEILGIVERAIERHGLCAAAAEHRIGTVPRSEPSVAVVASAPHRDAAFAGAREMIDEIKARAPIWKKEEGEWFGNDPSRGPLRELPAVHELAARLEAPHVLAVDAARRAIDEHRSALLDGSAEPAEDITARARRLVAELERASLTRVVNASGVILHTNLGRAPLPEAARRAVSAAAEGYSNLELDLESGRRGTRHDHVESLLRELTGAEAAIVVNNGAGAVLLAVAALAGTQGGVLVSRGQLVEIGGGFRIPEVIAQSGARLIEVGTTNRTRLSDYVDAVAEGEIDAILRVHQSNFRSVGFVEEVGTEALCGLGVPVIDDVGSGVLADASLVPVLAGEPSLRRSVAAGAALVCCSGDKLLGGPQAGLLVGHARAIAAARKHPLARALRIDKLSLAGLEATLRLYRDPERARREVPVLAMLEASEDVLAARARTLRGAIGAERAAVVRAVSRVGGGALPLLELEGPAVELIGPASPEEIMRALRAGEPPVIGRIHDGRVVLDPRTLSEAELDAVARAARTALE